MRNEMQDDQLHHAPAMVTRFEWWPDLTSITYLTGLL